jgi:hypothetical protein
VCSAPAKKVAELNERQKAAQGLQEKLDKSGAVMSEAARADLTKQVERANVDIQRATQTPAECRSSSSSCGGIPASHRPDHRGGGQGKGLHYIFNGLTPPRGPTRRSTSRTTW